MRVVDQGRRLAGGAGGRVARAAPGPCGRRSRRRTSRSRPGPPAWSGRGRCAGHRRRRGRTARPVASISWTSGTRVRRLSCAQVRGLERLMNTRDRAGRGGGAAASASSGSSSDSPIESKYVGCLVSGYTPMVRPARRDACFASRSTSSRVGTSNVPSYLRVRRPHSRQPLLGAQRLELGEREVLGEPARSPRGRRSPSWSCRSANSGCSATSVVPLISFSCRATSTPSFVDTRSGSM